jgi:hypothetical protein
MVDLGVKRKELHSAEISTSPKSEKDYANEKEYPELSLSGAHAEMMGAEDLKEGDVVEQKVRWRVKKHVKTTEGGKARYEMRLCMEKASDCEECAPDKKKSSAEDDGDGADDSPAMAFIQGKAARD